MSQIAYVALRDHTVPLTESVLAHRKRRLRVTLMTTSECRSAQIDLKQDIGLTHGFKRSPRTLYSGGLMDQVP